METAFVVERPGTSSLNLKIVVCPVVAAESVWVKVTVSVAVPAVIAADARMSLASLPPEVPESLLSRIDPKVMPVELKPCAEHETVARDNPETANTISPLANDRAPVVTDHAVDAAVVKLPVALASPQFRFVALLKLLTLPKKEFTPVAVIVNVPPLSVPSAIL
jgi:hypothetical protein